MTEYTEKQVRDIFDSYDFSQFDFVSTRLRKLGNKRKEQLRIFMQAFPDLVTGYAEVQYLYENRDKIYTRFCPVCGKCNRFNGHKREYYQYCSAKCSANAKDTLIKRKNTCMEKYGYESIQQCEEIKNKRIQTSKERYGNDYNHRSKAFETQRKHYNGKLYFNTDEHKVFMNDHRDEINKKIRNTIYNKTGKEWITQTTEFKEKRIDTLNKNGSTFISKGEQEIIDYIKELGFNPIKYITGQGDTRFEIDCYIPELNIGIEYNGIYYHAKNGRNNRANNYHYNKNKQALIDKIDLIQIWEDQWYNKKDIIKSILAIRLRKTKQAIYARKCCIKELNNDLYREFCNKYHIQGYRQASIRFGLYYNDELVQIASFNKPRNRGRSSTQNALYDYEFVRGCTILNTHIVGGTSKLFKHFLKIYNPDSVLSYVDWNFFNGNSYLRSGFKFNGYTGPNLFFVDSRLNRINRNPYKNKEHRELVKQNKLYECYGAGNLRMLYERSK